jgi:stress-induced-phosphoprotein 1
VHFGSPAHEAEAWPVNKSLAEHRAPDVLQKLKDAEKAKAEAEKQAYINPELADKARTEGNVQFKMSSRS